MLDNVFDTVTLYFKQEDNFEFLILRFIIIFLYSGSTPKNAFLSSRTARGTSNPLNSHHFGHRSPQICNISHIIEQHFINSESKTKQEPARTLDTTEQQGHHYRDV